MSGGVVDEECEHWTPSVSAPEAYMKAALAEEFVQTALRQGVIDRIPADLRESRELDEQLVPNFGYTHCLWDWWFYERNESNSGVPRCSLLLPSQIEESANWSLVSGKLAFRRNGRTNIWPDMEIVLKLKRLLVRKVGRSKAEDKRVQEELQDQRDSGGVHREVLFEYDGAFFHESATSIMKDLMKTANLLSAGFVVVRLREEPLKPLDVSWHRQSSNLLQLSLPAGLKGEGLEKAMAEFASEAFDWLFSLRGDDIVQE